MELHLVVCIRIMNLFGTVFSRCKVISRPIAKQEAFIRLSLLCFRIVDIARHVYP